MMHEQSIGDESTVDRESSSLRVDETASLEVYGIQLKQSRITPRQWLKANAHLPGSDGFRRQLWDRYRAAYPPPSVPGFTIEDVLGEGGMGLVYLARDDHLKRLVAIKELTDELRRQGGFQKRLRVEAQILAKLDHPNIVRVHQFISHAGREFIAMEYVPDGSLVERMRRSLDAVVTARLIAKLARAIDYAHTEQIIHRDLKPANILFDRNEEPKISDFGLAKNLLELSDSTQSAVAGTVHYMAPEQTEGKPPAPATDIWALGVILYRLLCGRMPFTGTNQGDLFVNIRTAPPVEMPATVAPALRAICLKCLHKNPHDRFQRALDLADALDKNAPPASIPRFGSRRLWMGSAAGAAVALLVAVSLTMGTKNPATVSKAAPESSRQSQFVTEGPTVGVKQPPQDEKAPGFASFAMMKERHAGYCSSIVFTQDGKRAISENGGGEISIWDLEHRLKEQSLLHTGKEPAKFQENGGIIAASLDGRFLVAAGVLKPPMPPQIMVLYDQKTYEPIGIGFGTIPAGMTGGIAFSPDGSKLAVAEARLFGLGKPKIHIVEVPSGKEKTYLVPAQLQSLAFSPDGTLVLSGGKDKLLTLWQLEPFGKKSDFKGHDATVDQVAFSTDGSRLYSASYGDDTLRVWNKDAATELKQIAVRKNAAKMVCAAFAPLGRAVTGHVDGLIRVWDLKTGDAVYEYKHQDVPPTAIAISADGAQVIAALKDHSVYLHRVPPPGTQ